MKIPTKLTKPQFERSIEPSLSKAKRGYVSKVPLYKIFNYILYKLSTGILSKTAGSGCGERWGTRPRSDTSG